MSSSSSAAASARRLKERSSSSTSSGGVVGAGGGKVTVPLKTSKTLTPISEKENNGSGKRPTGKENPRSVSRSKALGVCQKPVPIPKIDKQTVGSSMKDGETKVRWSTSSVPRGRSSSPSDFTRFLSDFRKERLPTTRVSSSDRSVKTLGGNVSGIKGGKPVNGFRVLEKSQLKESERIENGFRGLGESKRRSSNEFVRSEKNVEDSMDVNVKEINLKPNVGRSDIKDVVDGSLQGCKDNSYLDLDVKITCRDVVLNSDDKVERFGNGFRVLEKFRDSGHLGSNSEGVGFKALNGFKLSEAQKERGASEDKGVRVINKYPSKLHEKLAFLEGKVKRIVSDIKKTKEMLDKNNPDESKTIISDIQDKISCIEKDMVHVKTDKDDSSVSSRTVDKDNQQPKNIEKCQTNQVGHSKVSVTGLNHEELEARLFPHHKLLRGRTSLISLSASSQSDKSLHTEPSSSHSKPEEVPLSPIDNNPIALEFLASLHKGDTKEYARDEHAGLEFCEIQEMDAAASSAAEDNSNMVVAENCEEEVAANEVTEDFNNQENRPARVIPDEIEELYVDQVHVIGHKTSTGGWFVSEGESVLLAHDDGSCSYYDITNSEEKAEYQPPTGLSPNIWGDCWLIRAAGADGCSGRYVVAASSGSALESGFCSWDFYTKEVTAFHVEDKTITTARKILGPLPNIGLYRRSASSTIMIPENRQWWYKPCGPLLVSTSSSQKVVKVYDIRDGEEVMQWELQRPVIGMDHSSPLQWRNRGKVVLAETEAISLWDVNSLTPQALLTVASSGRRISALHVNNTDAELGGGVRRRVSSSEVEGNDGVFCTQDTINVLDFRLPSGVGLKISKHGMIVQSIFSRGDSIFLGCTDGRLSIKGQASSRVQQFSLRTGRLAGTYALPESNAHFHFSAISQVWGNSDFVMGVSPLGLFVFDSLQGEGASSLVADEVKTQGVKEIIGPDDMYCPSFDYLASRVLVISRDRAAFWRYL